jgi:hypothetical protein
MLYICIKLSPRYIEFTDLKEIVHDYGPVSNIGLNNIQERSTVQS